MSTLVRPVVPATRAAAAGLPGTRWLRHGLIILLVSLAVTATVQRGVLTNSHATFPIFRQSFAHLAAESNLYARYPEEQGREVRDIFKYSPSAAMVLAPLSLMPFLAGLLAWTLANALGVYAAVRRLMPGREGLLAMVIVYPSLIAAVQSTSSNGLIAALIVGAFVALEASQAWRAGAAIATATLMKLFPAAILPMALLRPGRWRVVGVIVACFAMLLAAPLLVSSFDGLAEQYRSWGAVLLADEQDLSFARSIMVVMREVSGLQIENWLVQGLATLILVTPLLFRRDQWNDAGFRKSFLASLLVYVVIFNHQSENASYVIASIGLAIWFLGTERTAARWVLLIACMAGLEAVPYFLVWLWMQYDLLGGHRLSGWLASKFDGRERVAGGAVAPAPEAAEA